MMEWLLKYNPEDLIWLRAPGYPTIKGVVINRSKTELFVNIVWDGKLQSIAVEDGTLVLPRKEGDEMPLSVGGVPFNKH